MRYVFGSYTLDAERHELLRADSPIKVRAKVFQVLAYLIAHRDRMVPKGELLETIWPNIVGEEVLNSCVMAARRAVDDDGRAQGVIKTVHGFGYRFVARVREFEQHPESASGHQWREKMIEHGTIPRDVNTWFWGMFVVALGGSMVVITLIVSYGILFGLGLAWTATAILAILVFCGVAFLWGPIILLIFNVTLSLCARGSKFSSSRLSISGQLYAGGPLPTSRAPSGMTHNRLKRAIDGHGRNLRTFVPDVAKSLSLPESSRSAPPGPGHDRRQHSRPASEVPPVIVTCPVSSGHA